MIEIIFLFILALVFALLEIEIEGKHGWAKKLPTWYRKSGFSLIFYKVSSGKPLSGYHLFMPLLMFLLLHMSFFLGVSWTWISELIILSYYILIVTFEDFLWFVLNPYYGLKKFRKEQIWWHSKNIWVFKLFPLDYLVALIISSALFYLTGGLQKGLEIITGLLILTFITILLSPLYRRYYARMRNIDERKLFK